MNIKGSNYFNFKTIKAEEIDQYKNIIPDIFNKKENGFLIKNVFDKDEIEKLRILTENLDQNIYTSTGSGFTYPMPFANVQDSESKNGYFESNIHYNNADNLPFEVSINSKVENLLKRISGNLFPVAPKFIGSENLAISSQIRCFKKNMGGLTVHSGNYFQNMFNFFYESLDENIGKYEQLSYFIMIQKPKKGGDLLVFDLTWDEAKEKPDFQNNDFIIAENGDHLNVSKISKTIVSPDPGDMFVFHGGEIWHQVNEIEGALDRITLGGFMARSMESNQLFLWA